MNIHGEHTYRDFKINNENLEKGNKDNTRKQ